MRQISRTMLAAAVLGMSTSVAVSAPSSAAKPAVLNPRKGSIQRATQFLKQAQLPDGSWNQYPGVTAVCALALLKSGTPKSDPAVVKATAYLATLARPNGAIYTDKFGPGQMLPNYNTALALLTLHQAGNPAHASLIKRAQEFLQQSQFDEGEGYSPSDRQYGGIGYGSKEDNPDVSNLQNALEALRDTGVPKDREVFKKAIKFLERCQNRSESNDQSWAGRDGGFVYASSGESKADEVTGRKHSSYGSMTYAGLKSYLYCGVSASDPRVRAAERWLQSNYSVSTNPGMGDAGLYYYYHTLAKTLSTLGRERFRDAGNREHAWREDLTAELVKRQRADGAWVNANPRWWEDRPELTTGYALLAMAYCGGKPTTVR